MEWLRLYVGTLDNPKVQGLPGGMFKAWVNCLCLARINDGVLPPPDVMAFRLRCSTRQAEQWRDDLAKRRLIDAMPDGAYRMHDWDQHQYISDGSTERVRKHREKQRCNVSGNVPGNVPGNVSVTPQTLDAEQTQTQRQTDADVDPESVRPSDPYFEGVRNLLTTYMGEHAAKPADDGIVRKTITAAKGATLDQLHALYKRLYNSDQSPRHANGPRGYGWFPAVTAANFRDGRGDHEPQASEPQAQEPEPSSKRTGRGLTRASGSLVEFQKFVGDNAA